jgi:hypothetical protein
MHRIGDDSVLVIDSDQVRRGISATRVVLQDAFRTRRTS